MILHIVVNSKQQNELYAGWVSHNTCTCFRETASGTEAMILLALLDQ